MLYTMNNIARRLRDFRVDKGQKQETMAKVGRMAQSAWAGWESSPPKALQSLVDLALYFGVSTDYLLDLTDNPRRKSYRPENYPDLDDD